MLREDRAAEGRCRGVAELCSECFNLHAAVVSFSREEEEEAAAAEEEEAEEEAAEEVY
jgi:hypothetical protein